MTAEDRAKNAGKVALVLEGGSFRGQFTAGVLDVLMEPVSKFRRYMAYRPVRSTASTTSHTRSVASIAST